MTITYGLTPQGFVAKAYSDVRAQINASLQSAYGTAFDVSDASVAGELAALVAAAGSDAWGASQGASDAFDPDAASDSALDALSALTATLRAPARSSVAIVACCGTPGTPITAGSLVTSASAGTQWGVTAPVTIATLTAWAATTAYALDDRATNGGACYQCVGAGTSAGSGGPSGTGTAIVDGGVTWEWIGTGTGAVDSTCASAIQDAIQGPAGDLTVIGTPIGGWSTAYNPLDAKLGNPRQSNASLRATRTAELAVGGVGPTDALRGALLRVSGVTACNVVVNDTADTIAPANPPHSVECIVTGGADADVAAAIYAQVGDGIATCGNPATTVTITDSQGRPQVIKFTRPTVEDVYVTIAVVYDPATYPADGDLLVAEAIATWGNALAVGTDVVASRAGSQAFSVAGVLDVPRDGSLGGTLIGTSASPSSDATIAIDQRHAATFDTSRIVVNSTPGTP